MDVALERDAALAEFFRHGREDIAIDPDPLTLHRRERGNERTIDAVIDAGRRFAWQPGL